MDSIGNTVKWLKGKTKAANISMQLVIDFFGYDRSTWFRWEQIGVIPRKADELLIIMLGNKIQEMIDNGDLPAGPGFQNRARGGDRFTKYVKDMFDAPTPLEE